MRHRDRERERGGERERERERKRGQIFFAPLNPSNFESNQADETKMTGIEIKASH